MKEFFLSEGLWTLLGAFSVAAAGFYLLQKSEWPIPDFIYVAACMCLLGTSYGLLSLVIDVSYRVIRRHKLLSRLEDSGSELPVTEYAAES